MRNKLSNARADIIRSLLAASFVLALAFTFTGCSDDKDGGGAACSRSKSINGSSAEVCTEISGTIGDEMKKDIKKECEKEAGGKFSNSCPSGYVVKCTDEADKHGEVFKTTTYFYGNEFKGLNCKDILHEDDD